MARDNSEQVGWLRLIAQGGRAGDAALRRLNDAYDAKVIGFCVWQYKLPQADAEELWQDVLVRIDKHAAEFSGQSDPASWIWAMVHHRAIDYLRGPARRHEVGEGPDDVPEAALPAAHDRTPRLALDDCVQRGLQEFGRHHVDEHLALSLRDLEGWGIPQMSAFLKRTQTATRQFLTSLRRKLKPFLKPCLELLSAET